MREYGYVGLRVRDWGANVDLAVRWGAGNVDCTQVSVSSAGGLVQSGDELGGDVVKVGPSEVL